MSKEIFYNRLIEVVRTNNKSINQVERELGYPRNALHNYKLRRDPSGTRLVELANYFEVSPEFLIGRNLKFSDESIRRLFNNLTTSQKKQIFQISECWILKQIK